MLYRLFVTGWVTIINLEDRYPSSFPAHYVGHSGGLGVFDCGVWEAVDLMSIMASFDDHADFVYFCNHLDAVQVWE